MMIYDYSGYDRHTKNDFGMGILMAAFKVAASPAEYRDEILEREIKQMMRKANCEFCAHNVPLNVQGDHEILGLLFACDAAPAKPDFDFAEPAKLKSRKQAARLVTGRGMKSRGKL